MGKSKFFEEIKSSLIEREVEDVYNKGISLYFPNVDIKHPFACDGFIDTKQNGKLLKLIIEYKYDEDFVSKMVRAKVISQVLFYVKQFELNGMVLPNVCLVGDINECFVFHTNSILKYLDKNLDWSIAPSNAYQVYPQLVAEIASDDDINPFVFDITDEFSFKIVADKIKDLAENVQRYVHITEHNIATIYETFLNRVVRNKKKLTSHDLVSVFMGVITNGDEYYKHPTKKNLLVTPKKNIEIDSSAFDAFFSYFQRTYTPQEKNNFSAIADRLIEDTDRRNSGDYFTPTKFTDYSHKMISEYLGENWRDEYVVWDPACGTGNLTRDYRFAELYCSTLFESELEIGKRYNQEATKFQFDFLNDYFPMKDDIYKSDSKVPDGLIKALEQNKPIVFFLNPPYATACNQGETSKDGINDTQVRKQMQVENLGGGAENLQHQFLYRICKIKESYKLTNCYIALFSKPIFLSGAKQSEFLKYLCSNFKFINGTMFQASHFSDVSGMWGITFNIWENGVTSDIHNFKHSLIDKNEYGDIIEIGSKNIYNAWNDVLASKWVREPLKSITEKSVDMPNMTNAVSIKEKNTRGTNLLSALGYMHNNANSVQYNQTYVGLYASPFAAAHGLACVSENFTRCTALFSARKLIIGNWVNDKDEYIAPNTTDVRYREFELDSVVYSLFNTSSNQSSLRNIEYKGKLWDIKNDFFFMSKKEMEELANDNGNDICYNGVHTSQERYVYNYLNEHRNELSVESLNVLEKSEELVRKSFKYRMLFDEEHPEYQINNWDCGWYQIKGMLKMFMPNELKEFQQLYKVLSDKMRPMVYELGFLK